MSFLGRAAMVVLLAAGFTLVQAPATAACLKANQPGQVAEGTLTAGRFRDAAGRPEQAYILTLQRPGCLEGSDETDKIAKTQTVQVFSPEDRVQRRIGQFVGQRVRVIGDPFGQHTAHHHAPIVMLLSAIDPL